MQHYSQGQLAKMPPSNMPEAAPPSTTITAQIERLQSIVGHTDDLATTSERIADQLQGSRGVGVGTDGPTPVPNGCVDILEQIIGNIQARLSRIDIAHKRALQALG